MKKTVDAGMMVLAVGAFVVFPPMFMIKTEIKATPRGAEMDQPSSDSDVDSTEKRPARSGRFGRFQTRF